MFNRLDTNMARTDRGELSGRAASLRHQLVIKLNLPGQILDHAKQGQQRRLQPPGQASFAFRAKLDVTEVGSRWPLDFTIPRTALRIFVRVSTATSRARTSAKPFWVLAERRWMGDNNSGPT